MSRLIPYDAAALQAFTEYYHSAIWPMQIASLLSISLIIIFLIKPSKTGSTISISILAASYLWVGIVYHGIYYAELNWLAWFYAPLFVIQAILVTTYGLIKNQLIIYWQNDIFSVIGILVILSASALMPLIDEWFTKSSTVIGLGGLTPDSLTVAFLGLLLFTRQKTPKRLLFIPFLWCILSIAWKFLLVSPVHLPLLLLGIISIILILVKNKHRPKAFY